MILKKAVSLLKQPFSFAAIFQFIIIKQVKLPVLASNVTSTFVQLNVNEFFTLMIFNLL